MGKLLMGILFIGSMIIACSTPTNKKMIKDRGQIPTNVETKTNTSSSAAKAIIPADSSVVIRPVHKYQHHKKLKLK
ncbi:MAG TPA: hypothetical protein VNT20_03030 [Flavisolibacter sp.]|jgi:hypothetical protein|nr:hypothetical protein [Flavisolibacter sp.]